VLKGDMGLAGPRLLLMEYLPLAEVRGLKAIRWKESFKLDS